MTAATSAIPDNTLEVLARTFCREADKYGFTNIDYLRYINFLMDQSAQGSQGAETPSEGLDQPLGSFQLPVAGKRVRVRAFQSAQDQELFTRWLDDEYGRYFLLSRTSGQREDMKALLDNPDHAFGVIESGSGNPIGALAYLDYDKQRHKAELRKMIGSPEHRGTGLAREATALWIRYGLSTLGLRKIYVNTLHTHIRNIKLNESLGFKVEGLLRNEAFIDGKYHDVLRMGLCADNA